MQLTPPQVGVGMGMASALLLTLGAFFSPILPQINSGPEARFALWLACSLLCAVWLLICVGRLAKHRFFTPADIDGSGITPNTPAAMQLQAVLQNTLEQSVLAFIAYGAWIWLGPPERSGLIIVYTCFFGLGRLAFFIGYARGAPARAFGFGLTFYPTVCLIIAAIPSAISQILVP
jgi:MAPEG family